MLDNEEESGSWQQFVADLVADIGRTIASVVAFVGLSWAGHLWLGGEESRNVKMSAEMTFDFAMLAMVVILAASLTLRVLIPNAKVLQAVVLGTVAALLLLLGSMQRAHADGLYFETELSARKQLHGLGYDHYNANGKDFYVQEWYPYDVNRTKNPYMSVALGYAKDVKLGPMSLQLNAKLFHESSLDTGSDHGVNSIRVGVRVWLLQ